MVVTVQELRRKYIGRAVPRLDVDKVVGKATFAYEHEVPGTLHAKLVGSPHAHARIKAIDVSDAAKVPGVVAVFTGEDFDIKVGKHVADRDVLAKGRALYVGHPVAAVVAQTIEAAEEAAEKVVVEYEELPAVFDPLDALKPEAPIIHPEQGKYRRLPFIHPVEGTNIADHFKLRKGDVERAFEEADVIVEDVYRLPMLHHGYLEPWACTAMVHGDGTVELWVTNQGPFTLRDQLAETFGLPTGKIVIHHMYLGGGFGGKADLMLEHIPIAISMKLGGRPVRLALNREELLHYAFHRANYIIKMKTAATKDGRLLAHKGEYYYNTGFTADLGVLVGQTIGFLATGPYDIPNVWIDSYTIYTNMPGTTAFRGYTHSELHFAFEQQMDQLAEKLGMDPVEFRLKNIWRPGHSETPTGQKLREDAGAPGETLRRAAELIEWWSPPIQPKEPWKIRAKGIAVCPKGPSQPSNAASSAIVKLNEDGSVDLLVGQVDMGMGTLTAFAQIVAEELDIPIEKVNVYNLPRTTASTAYDWGTYASRALFAGGQAILRAIEDLKSQIRKVAAHVFKVSEDEIEVEEGKAKVKGMPWLSVELKDLALGYTHPDGRAVYGPLIGRGSHVPDVTTALNEFGQGNPWMFITFGTTAVEIEVDLLTGQISIPKAVIVVDTPVVNPILALGQGYGGTVMGTNIGLREEIKFDENGRILNPNFTDYKLARIKDIPEEIKIEFLGYGQKNAPYGAKGIGELMMVGWPAALANAVARALGIRFRNPPLSPDKIVEAVKKHRPELLERLKGVRG